MVMYNLKCHACDFCIRYDTEGLRIKRCPECDEPYPTLSNEGVSEQ